LRISVTNIGPVKRADIELAPLTVFIGPNNSGKSVIATLIYATFSQAGIVETAVRSSASRHPRGAARRRPRGGGRAIPAAATGFQLDEFYADGPDSLEELTEAQRSIISDLISLAINDYLEITAEEIARATGSQLRQLRRKTNQRASSATISVKSTSTAWQASIHQRGEKTHLHLDVKPDLAEVWDAIPDTSWTMNETLIGVPLPLLLEDLIESALREFPLHTKYLPAARSGILQTYKTLTGSIVRRSSWAGITDRQFPAMTGIVADFIGEMVELDPRAEGDFAEEADRLEQEVLHGRIGLQGEPSPEVVYRTQGGDYSIGQTSSMVSELAPVVLYLRHKLRSGDLLLIEEPEAHLHPATQVAFAKSLVRLVNRGLRVGLTTHSEFFLQQINNAIMAGALADLQVDDREVSPDRIDGSEVAAYFFDTSSSGTNVVRLPVDPKEGIPEVSFDAVTEQLYNETIAMDRSMGGQG
jgi:predicted ATPase